LIIPRLARCSISLTLGKLRRQVKKTNLYEAIRDICFTSAKISHEIYPEHRRRVRDDNYLIRIPSESEEAFSA
jgi:hypothetical protein